MLPTRSAGPEGIDTHLFFQQRAGDVVAATRETYDGPLVIGEDLMSFEIGETVTARKFTAATVPV